MERHYFLKSIFNNKLSSTFVGLVLFILSPTLLQAQCTVTASASQVDIVCGETVKLSAAGSGVLAFHANINCSQVQCPQAPNFGTWAQTSTAQYNNPCNPQHPNNNPYLWFNQNSASPRVLATGALNLTNGGSVTFDMRMADPDLNGNASPCENPDSEDEGVFVQYSTDGVNWVTISYYSPNGGNDPTRTTWNTYQDVIPSAGPNTRVRLAQLNNTGSTGNWLDHWGVEDITVIANPPTATYTWSHTGVTKVADASTPDVQPTQTTTYTVTYNDGADQCTDDVTVNVTYPVVTAATDKTSICPGETVNLTATEDQGEQWNYCTRDVNTGCKTAPITVTGNIGGPLGDHANNFSAIFGAQGRTGRAQWIYTANELKTIGMTAGKITELGLNILYIEDFSGYFPRCQNFAIKLSCTNKANFNDRNVVGGVQTVYSRATQNFSLGWNTFILDQAYNWDGTSNLVVDICFLNTSGDFTEMEFQTNSLNVYRWISDGTNGNSTNYCSRAVTWEDYDRPVTRFKYCQPFDPPFQWVWSPDDGSFNPNVNTQNPSASPPATTTYTVKGKIQGAPDGCYVEDQVTINVADFSAFSPSATDPICVGDNLQLTAGLPGMTTYTWSGPNGFNSNQENPTINGVTAAASGTYTITVANGSCSDTKTINVNVQSPPTAGSGSTADLCTNSPAYDLNSSLTGADPGGTWSDDDASGALSGSTFNPGGVPTAGLPKTYNFTYTVTNVNCGSRTTSSAITVYKEPEAGTGQTATICETGGTVNLTTYLTGPFDPGTWNDLDGSGQLTGAVFNPAGLSGTFRFEHVVAGTAPCTDATTIVTLTVFNPSNPGVPRDTTLCSNSNVLDLFKQLDNFDAQGSWSDDDNTGILSGSTIDPTLIDKSTLTNTFDFTHSLTDLCGTHRATVSVTIIKEPNAGNNKQISICATASPINLRTHLSPGFDNGGTWQDPDGSGQLTGSVFDPNGLGGNSYRFWYIVGGVAPCKNDTAEIKVTVTQNPTAGTGSSTTVCQGDADIDLFTLLSGHDNGGNWVDKDNSLALSGSIFKVKNVNPNVLTKTFRFTYSINDGCTTVEEDVSVTVQRAPRAGNDVTKNLCATGGPVNLEPFRAGQFDNGGRWEDPGNSGALSGNTFDPTGRSGEQHLIWYIVDGVAPCQPETANFTLNIIDQPVAGDDNSIALCMPVNIDMLTQLNGNPDGGGTWQQTNNPGTPLSHANGVLNVPNDGTIPSGTYNFTYTIDASAPCNTVSADLSIELRNAPEIYDVVTTCTPDLTGYTVTFKVRGGDKNSYSVNYAGSFAADGVTYTADPIPSNQAEVIEVSDAWACAKDQITVTKDCDCKTRVSTLNTQDTLLGCGSVNLSAVIQTAFVNDGDDAEAYYLHTGTANTLVGIIKQSLTNSFAFDASTMAYGTVYYISAAAGDAKADGYPDENDPCYQVAAGTPVVWFPQPQITSSTDKSVICPGEQVNFDIDFPNLDFAPYTYSYSYGGTTVNDTNDGSFASKNITDAPLSNTTYIVNFIQDSAGCRFNANQQHPLDVNKSARADIQSATVCSDANPLAFDVAVSGDGDSWTVVYTNDLDNSETTVSNITAAGTQIPVSLNDPNQAITYTLKSVADNSGSICPGVVTGSYTVNPAPTAQIVNSDATYCEGTVLDFNFVLTGIGPWTIDLQDDASNTYTVNANTRNFSTTINSGLPAGTYQFTISQVTDNASGCVSPGSGSPATININPGPRAQLGFGLQDPLDANPVKSITVCDGTPVSFDIQYLSGSGNTFTADWTLNGTAQPAENLSNSQKTTVSIPAASLPPGTHTVALTALTDASPAACRSSNLDQLTIVVKRIPQVALNFREQDICEGTSVTVDFTVTADDDVVFDIHDQNGFVKQIQGSATGGSQSFTLSPSAPGSYTYSVQNLSEAGVTPACPGTHTPRYNLNVIQLPTANLNNPDITLCQGTPVVFDYQSTGTPNLTVDFLLTNTNDATTFNYSDVTVGGNDNFTLSGLAPGNYNLSLPTVTDGSVASCSAAGTGQLAIDIIAAPGLNDANFSVNPVCFDEATSFDFNIQGNGPFTVRFEDGQGNSFNVNVDASGNYSHPITANTSTTYRITYIEDNTTQSNGTGVGCTAQSLPSGQSLTVNALPGLDFLGDDKICFEETGQLSLNTYASPGDFQIEFFDAISNRKFTRNYSAGAPSIPVNLSMYNGLDSMRFEPISITDVNTGCVGDTINGMAKGSNLFLVKPLPTDVFQVSELGGCAPFEPNLSFYPSQAYNSRVVNWTWTVDGRIFSDVNELDLYLDKQGSQTDVSLSYQTIHGCSKPDQSTRLFVYPDPVADFVFTPEEPSTLDYQVQFYEKTVGASDFVWYVEKDSILKSPRFVYDFPHDTEGFFEVCLQAQTNFGCVDSLCKPVYVKGVNLGYIPNAFTPDGDGINDVFMPVLSEIKADGFSMQIFNRWGELIYETNDPDEGWNGITNMGEPAPAGMYVYKIKAATAFVHGRNIDETGRITVLR